jgi:hypothetical protein
MSRSSLLHEAFHILNTTRQTLEHESIQHDFDEDVNAASLEGSGRGSGAFDNDVTDAAADYDDIVKQVYNRKVNSSLAVTSDIVDKKSSVVDFIESSAEKAQALVSLDYFSDKFRADDSLKELEDVNNWVELTARNHSNFMFYIESEKRPEAHLHDNEELGYIYSLDIENVSAFSDIYGEYIKRNSNKFNGTYSMLLCVEWKGSFNDAVSCRFAGSLRHSQERMRRRA